jgi:ActR/RegA family two-component response regulator
MPARKRILFVDDEASIRLTLPPVLEKEGFQVHVAGSVAEALVEINSYQFDVLLTDLNIREEGDGFLVVSAMRHLQPNCVNLILTGYPAFETALQAIHNQVDDYLVKPADVESLIKTVQEKLATRDSQPAAGPKRLSAILRENSSEITRQMLQAMKRDRKIASVPLSDEERLGHLPKLLNALIELLERGGDEPSAEELRLAGEHGKRRKKQGYSIPTVIKDFDFLQQPVYDLIQNKLMGMDVTGLVSDLKRLQSVVEICFSCFSAAPQGRIRQIEVMTLAGHLFRAFVQQYERWSSSSLLD